MYLIKTSVFLVLRRKWRFSVARQEEIRRLLVLASEETARAELEATVSYTPAAVATTLPVAMNGYHCAVCYCPTTTRCAQCKAVRYCSSKCQIIHWRQGHKEECRPRDISFSTSNNASNSANRVSKPEQCIIDDSIYENANIRPTHSEPPFPDFSVKDGDDDKAPSVADTDGACSASESSGTFFSGFSSSSPGGESSDDISVGESVSSSEPYDSGKTSADVSRDIQDKVDQTKPSSPKFTSFVDSLDSTSKLSKLYNFRSDDDYEDSLSATSAPLSQSTIPVVRGSIKPQKFSDFWGRALDSVSSSSNAEDDSSLLSSNRAMKLSHYESSLQFKFNLSGSVDHISKVESSMAKVTSNDSHETAVGKPVNRLSSSVKSGVNEIKVRSSPSVSSEGSDCRDNKTSNGSDVPKSSELKSGSSYSSQLWSSSRSEENVFGRDASKVKRFSPTNLDNSNHIASDIAGTFEFSKSKLPSDASQHKLTAGTSVRSVSKVINADVCPSNVSHNTSFSASSIYGLKSSVQKVVDQFRGPKCGRYSDKELFPYDLFVKLYTSNKVHQPFGLINCGNSCYANAVLQCLAFTPPLTAFFVQGLHSKACMFKLAEEGKSPLSPVGILSQLPSMGSLLGNGREEDAHEFLRYAIDAMQSVCHKDAGVNTLGSAEEETTLVGLTFGGYLHSKIKCLNCHYKSERQERMMDLAVEIGGEIDKLEDALRRFTSTEILDGDNKYECCRCKSYQKARKKLAIMEAPNILTIALKRFQSGKFGKLNKPIRFPEVLNLAPYMSGTSDKTPIYRLYGVIVHLDVMNAAFSGHYVCYVKNIQNKWFKIDDSTVAAVELESVLTKGAYMLLYARCSPRATRLIRSKIVPSDAKGIGSLSRTSGKNTMFNSRSTSTRSNIVQMHPDSIGSDNIANVESFYLKFHRLQRILEEDSSSDNLSFTSSSNSDEGSYSTDSTRDSTSTDDLSDFIFGGCNSSWRNMPDSSDTSSSPSSSPMHYWKCQNTSRHQTYHEDAAMEDRDLCGLQPFESSRKLNLEGGVGPFLQPDTAKHRRNLSGGIIRKLSRERTC
ncbi:hypothetical protein K2173_012481 [Erythroxylum novogranatense]|uniref:ubiquitinyl hydrolase 1 n=1 Tax=Erythroxylum novogranatense TaxID=1862640 RepID=A0AAV8S5U2_9ROSI|nr:hypothetical protein K2173_012481 [Erythroxylum novogranatense]